jgi:NitT/TauT family transport system substrate-binding protein
MKTMTRRRMLTVSAAACLTGCASAQTTKTQAVEKPDLTVGAVQSTTAAGLYLAVQHGFFAVAGLAVKVVPITGSGPAMTALLNGTIDVSFGNYVSFIAAQAKGAARLRILAEGNNATAREEEIMTWKGSPITTVAGLRGKTIAVNALAGVGTLLVSSVLAENAAPVSSVKFTAIPFPDMDTALSARRVDAAWMVEPYITQSEISSGAVAVADCDQGATQNFPVSGYVVTGQWASRYPRTVAAFTAALNRGQVLADTSRPAVERVLPQYIKISKAAAALVVTGSYPVAPVNRVAIQRVADVMHQFGVLPRPFDVAPMVGGQ